MIRTFAAAGGLSLVAAGLASGAAAQTWGQPVYVSPYDHVVGGTPLSEVETRAHAATGRWADGYADQAYVYVPAPVYSGRYGHGQGYASGNRYAYGRYGYTDRGGRYDPPSRPGYRDEWGYNDDRHPMAARGWSRERRASRYDRDCGCGDVYFYDR